MFFRDSTLGMYVTNVDDFFIRLSGHGGKQIALSLQTLAHVVTVLTVLKQQWVKAVQMLPVNVEMEC